MARRKKERAQLSGTVKPSAEEVKLPPEKTNGSVVGAELQPADRNNLGSSESELKTETNSGFVTVSKERKQTGNLGVRRSVRLHGRFTPEQNQEIERAIQEITLSGSEEEKEEPSVYEETEQHGPTTGNKKLEEKIDCLVQLLKELQDRYSPSGIPCHSNPRYKRLYIDSQKKIETLSEENHQLSLRLEKALGKLEVYEKGPRAYSEMLDKVKDVYIVSNMSSVAEGAANVPAVREANTSSPKRRKLDRERRNN